MKTHEDSTQLVVHVGSDEATIRDAVGELDTSELISVQSVENAAQATTILEAEPVDCLVCESGLPDESAVSFVTSACETRPSLRCLLVTADGSLVDEALAAGVTDVVVRRDGADTTQLLARRLDNTLPGPSPSLSEFGSVVPDDMYAVDDDGTITDLAPSADGILANSFTDPTTLLGDQLSTVLRPANHDGLAEVLQTVAGGDQGHRITLRATVEANDGSDIPCEVSLAPFSQQASASPTFVAVVRDISEHLAREEELTAERDFSALLLNAINDVFYLVAPDGNLERWNDRFREVTGYTDEELAEMHALDFFEGADKERVAAAIGGTLETGAATVEAEFVTKDGEAISYDFTGAQLTDDDGTLRGLVGIGRDISDRKERIQKLEQLKQNVTDVVWMSTPGKDSMDFISDSYEAVWGRSPTSLHENPTSFVDAIHPEDRQRVEEALADQQDNPDEYEETYRVVQPDGEIRWVNDRSAGVYEDGSLVRIVGVASDITKRKKREQELELKNRAIDEAPIGITIHDSDSPTSAITYANAGFEKLTGYAQGSLDGRGLSLLTGADTASDRFERLEQAFEHGEPASVVALLYRREGQPFWGRISAAPVTDDDGDVSHFVVFLQNVTETKEHEQEIERRLSEFAEILAQDLQTPIQTAQQALETAKESGTTEDIETAERSLERVDKLIDDLATVHSFSVKSRDVSETVSTDSGMED